jgi:hypothetical protein
MSGKIRILLDQERFISGETDSNFYMSYSGEESICMPFLLHHSPKPRLSDLRMI